jgi:F0F1-type ATP synthase membrane subunit a
LARAGRFGTLFELLVEKVYEFFEEILEETGKRWTKIYVVTLFFVILISNLSSWVLDVIRVVFLDTEAIFQYIQIPTTSFEFNIAMALVSIALFLIVQVRYLGLIKFFHEYLPITGKGILDIKK